jgi:predicted secreted protein
MPSTTFNLGINAKLFLNTVEMKNVTDVTVTLDAGEVDVTTRDNDGFRATIGGLKECTIEFDMLDKSEDNSFDTIQSAWYNATSVNLKALSSTNGAGPHGDFSITGFSRSEALEEAVKYSVTAKLTKWIAWISSTTT